MQYALRGKSGFFFAGKGKLSDVLGATKYATRAEAKAAQSALRAASGKHYAIESLRATRTGYAGHSNTRKRNPIGTRPRVGQITTVRGQRAVIVAVHAAGTIDVRIGRKYYRVTGLGFV